MALFWRGEAPPVPTYSRPRPDLEHVRHRYQGGRFSFRFEEPIHRFQNMLIDKMTAQEDTRYRIPAGDSGFHDVPEEDSFASATAEA